MEIAIVVLIIGLVFYLVSKRFQGYIRDSFYLELLNENVTEQVKVDDEISVSGLNKRGKLEVKWKGNYLGIVPDDYFNLIKRHMPKEGNLRGKIVLSDKKKCKVKFNVRGEARDLLGE